MRKKDREEIELINRIIEKCNNMGKRDKNDKLTDLQKEKKLDELFKSILKEMQGISRITRRQKHEFNTSK